MHKREVDFTLKVKIPLIMIIIIFNLFYPLYTAFVKRFNIILQIYYAQYVNLIINSSFYYFIFFIQNHIFDFLHNFNLFLDRFLTRNYT